MKVLSSPETFKDKYVKRVLGFKNILFVLGTTSVGAGSLATAVGTTSTAAMVWSAVAGLPWIGGLFAGKATAAAIAAGTAALGSPVVLVPALLLGGGAVAYLYYFKNEKKCLQGSTGIEMLANAVASVVFLPMLARAVYFCKAEPSSTKDVRANLLRKMGEWGYSESYARDTFDNAMQLSPDELDSRYDQVMRLLEAGSTDGMAVTPKELPPEAVQKFAEEFRTWVESCLPENFVEFTFQNELEKLKKEFTNLEMGKIRKLADGGYQMDVKYGDEDWQELDMVRRPKHVTPFEVHGGIAKVWRGEGGVKGKLGYPISNEEQLPLDYSNAVEGDRVSYFEHGRVIWHRNNNRIEVNYN